MTQVNHLGWSLIAAACLQLISGEAQAAKYVVDLESVPASSQLRQQAASGSVVMALDLDEAEASRLAAEGIVVEANIQYRVLGERVEGPLSQAQWAANAMKVPKAHALSDSRGVGQRVCVVDTGVDKSHAMLAGKVVSATSRVPKSGPGDVQGHGTHVASLIAGSADLGAIATGAKIISVKALGDDGVGDTDWIANAIGDCVKLKANVINMSLGAYTSSVVLQRAIQRAKRAGVTVVAASGNDGGKLNYPAAYPETIAVGATNSNSKVSSFSNRGSGLDFVAPGEAILGARAGGGTVHMTGTSMASPFVAGLVAMKNSRKAVGLQANSLNLPSSIQGRGLVNAHETALNR